MGSVLSEQPCHFALAHAGLESKFHRERPEGVAGFLPGRPKAIFLALRRLR
jgi:hypothetical protein